MVTGRCGSICPVRCAIAWSSCCGSRAIAWARRRQRRHPGGIGNSSTTATRILVGSASRRRRGRTRRGARRDPEKIVEETRPALSTRERAIERCHGAREAGIVVVEPGAQHRPEQAAPAPGRAPCRLGRRRRCRRRSASIAASARASAVERERETGIARGRARQRAHRGLVRREHLDAGASSRRTDARAAALRPCRRRRRPAPRGRSSFMWAARIARVEPNVSRRSASETPARVAISAKPMRSIDFSASSAMNASVMRSRSDLLLRDAGRAATCEAACEPWLSS